MVVLLWLAVLQFTAAYDNPFSWKAVEDAERQATAKLASLYADSIRLQQKVKDHVLAPITDRPPPPECLPCPTPAAQPQATGSATALVFTLVVVPAAFLLGWICGKKQGVSQQAMREARAADQQAEAVVQGTEASTSDVVASVAPLQHLDQSSSQAASTGTRLDGVQPVEPDTEVPITAGTAIARSLSSIGSGSDVSVVAIFPPACKFQGFLDCSWTCMAYHVHGCC